MTRLPLPAFALALALASLAACSASPPPSDDTATTPPPVDDAPAEPAPPAPVPPPPGEDDGDTVATIPARFHGEWNSHLPDCGTGNNESRLTVDATTLRFYEATAQVESVRVDGDTLSVDTTLSGEGVSRDRTFNYTLSADGNTLTDSEGGLARLRCGG